MRVATLLALFVATSLPARAQTYTGYASIYATGVMEAVSRHRGLPVVPCMIATPLVARVGVWVSVTSGVTGERLRCRTTDVVHPRDQAAHLRTRHYVEFDNRSGRRMCRVRYAGQQPRRACPVTITEGVP